MSTQLRDSNADVSQVDMKKLTELAGFNTEKTCSNTWGVIKKKLAAIAEQNGKYSR